MSFKKDFLTGIIGMIIISIVSIFIFKIFEGRTIFGIDGISFIIVVIFALAIAPWFGTMINMIKDDLK